MTLRSSRLQTLAALLVAAVYLAVTTPWLSVSEGVERFRFHDTVPYLAIARSAPALPDVTIGSAYVYRWPLHWTIGALSQLLGVPVTAVYSALAVTVTAAVVATVWSLSRAHGGLVSAVAATGLVVVVPFDARLFLVGPAMLADAVCALGVLVAVRGLLTVRTGRVVVGCLVMAVSRQSGAVVLPLVAAWCLVGPRWRDLPARSRWLTAVPAVTIPAAAVGTALAVAAPFSTPYAPDPLRDNIVVDLLALPAGGIGVLRHLVLSVDSVWIAVVGFLVVALSARRRTPSEAWWVFAVGVLLAVQPILVSPRFPGLLYNEPRIAAIGLPVLAVALAIAWRCERLSRRGWVGLVSALALVSVTRDIGWPAVATPLALAANVLGAAFLFAVLRRSSIPPGPSPRVVTAPRGDRATRAGA
ncbi:hypothetical protein [Pseudonocardia charpentierae]|uniref:Glycosyltransferase RgtA/B/C/D-like domain-containing protein n=1 Tax=Pseudonocardia charpentierae TaxID=3075545 RepID=A0ABU2NIH8_9PSEU|nr:hypothetical protein [Pseudonocardia sp. DSM 45834]MDT0353515.1 hypothetical protein [Pseudonocardia sp. DSM 45834]